MEPVLMEGLSASGWLCSVITGISGFRIELHRSDILIAEFSSQRRTAVPAVLANKELSGI